MIIMTIRGPIPLRYSHLAQLGLALKYLSDLALRPISATSLRPLRSSGPLCSPHQDLYSSIKILCIHRFLFVK